MMSSGQVSFVANVSLQSALHPLTYTKVLMQLGYEPREAREGRSLLGSPVLVSANLWEYIGDMKLQDGGVWGPYRGLSFRVLASLVGSAAAQRTMACVSRHTRPNRPARSTPPEPEEEEEGGSKERAITVDDVRDMLVETRNDTCAKVVGVVLSHPAHVLATRMMAEFIGKETLYSSSWFSGIHQVYEHEGIRGFFAGLLPRLVCELSCIWLTNTITFFVQRLLIDDRDLRKLCKPVVSIFVGSLLYPLQVVGTVMTVNGSGLAAGKPPNTPIYSNWIACYWDMSQKKQLKRGARMFWRYQPIRLT